MYCKNCGSKMDDIAVICVKCGAPKGQGFKYCMECGNEVSPLKDTCDNCGCSIEYNALQPASSNDNALSIIGLVLGIASLILLFVIPLLGLACGIAAIIIGKIASEKRYGDSFAKAAVILGIASIVVFLLRLVAAFAFLSILSDLL